MPVFAVPLKRVGRRPQPPTLSTRAEALMAYGGGLVRVDSAQIRDLDSRVYGHTGVALGRLQWGGQTAGRPFAGTVRFQHVWVQQ